MQGLGTLASMLAYQARQIENPQHRMVGVVGFGCWVLTLFTISGEMVLQGKLQQWLFIF